jgi:hypothetical protein
VTAAPAVQARLVVRGDRRESSEPAVQARLVVRGDRRESSEPAVQARLVVRGDRRESSEPAVQARLVVRGDRRESSEPAKTAGREPSRAPGQYVICISRRTSFSVSPAMALARSLPSASTPRR